MVKNVLAGFGLVFILLILTVGFLYERWKSLDKTSYEYAMDSASFIFANWDFQELKNRADGRMFTSTNENSLKSTFTTLAQLGALQSVEGCEGEPAVSVGNGLIITGKYMCQMKFQKDKVMATFILSGNPDAILHFDNNDSWKILALSVNSNYLAKSVK